MVKWQSWAKKSLKLIKKRWRRKLIEWIRSLVTKVNCSWLKGCRMARHRLWTVGNEESKSGGGTVFWERRERARRREDQKWLMPQGRHHSGSSAIQRGSHPHALLHGLVPSPSSEEAFHMLSYTAWFLRHPARKPSTRSPTRPGSWDPIYHHCHVRKQHSYKENEVSWSHK